MAKARIAVYLIFILLMLAGCPTKGKQPATCPSAPDSNGVWMCYTCTRLSSDPTVNGQPCPTVEPSLQVGRQPAPSGS